MNNTLILNSIRFVFLLAAQVVIFNNINLLGYVNPYPYILFIILYPVNANKSGLLLSSFALGIIMDMFCNSGGVHATACVILAYMRPMFLKFSFGISYEYQTVKINDKLTPERFSFILISVITHHMILFLLEIFRFNLILDILLRTVLSTIFTVILCIVIIYIFKPTKR
ncbi:rod shape-determining protein MreD [Flavobacterium sp. '19STA2R22 D10 B1']|uniref:rod shape-determining protein MreD n=1 Tax=Flavobacterium aerium TaxID=3037261 RepID=UPI00278BC245|nr:rod shape-determining protein MreD [Flavobacterium sp. '19STA2R22 D10 B1']